MPVCPGTAMTYRGHPEPPGDPAAVDAAKAILAAHPAPSAEELAAATAVLRTYIRRTTAELKTLAERLPAQDPRRAPARRTADSAFFRAAQEDGPGNGLMSARDYCRRLLWAALEVREYYDTLRKEAQGPDGTVCEAPDGSGGLTAQEDP
ncbi:DUF6415 family natural product biosynthesis protein [Streptomyces gamaensis]|uniref:DUF6415 family natural product biosynthesis protein n=1 Tax=Streptomyces gamaensis TaxID=1763542 RepID=A0ABW0Z004_9ACTN